MKNISKILLAGVLMSSIIAGGGGTVFANSNETNYTDSYVEWTADDFDSLEDYLKTIDGLTSEDIARLVATDKSLEPQYKELEEIGESITKIYDGIVDVDGKLETEYTKIYEETVDIWDKLYSEELVLEDEATDADYINASSILSVSEKSILLNSQERLNELDKIMEVQYLKAQEAAADLIDKENEVLKIVDAATAKDQEIWDKINEEYVR